MCRRTCKNYLFSKTPICLKVVVKHGCAAHKARVCECFVWWKLVRERVFPSTHLVADIGSSHPTKSKILWNKLWICFFPKDIHDFLKFLCSSSVSTPDKLLSHPTSDQVPNRPKAKHCQTASIASLVAQSGDMGENGHTFKQHTNSSY